MIKIDGQNIKQIGLHKLRKNIAYIPQAPFLLQGTIQENLDPFHECSPEEIQQVIRDVHLEKKIS
jgi:ABC-type multidrug transport system fused ATPase/permease subunit